MAEGVWKGGYPEDFGRSLQLSPNKYFDQRSYSMRKGCDGEEEENQPSGARGTCSPPETPVKYKMIARGPKMTEGVWKGVYP